MQATRARSHLIGPGPAVPLLAATAWSIAALGGSRVVDMAIATALVCLAFALSGYSARAGLRLLLRTPVGVGALGVVVWTSAVGLTTSGPGFAALRWPWLLVMLVVTAAAANRLTEQQRVQVAGGLVVIGVVLAGSAILEWVRSALGGDPLPIRAAGLLGYPNGAGVLLVATSLTTVSLRHRGLLGAAQFGMLLGVQALGVLVTGSRLALLTAVACIAVMAWTRRSPAAVGVAVAVAAPFIAVLVQRFATSRPERVDLWRSALSEIQAHPLLGRGTAPQLVLSPTAGGKPTTHAHNEFLQLTVEYGFVGLVLVLLAIGLLLWSLVGRHLDDVWLAAGALAIATLAVTDFALRIPGVSLALALLVPLAWCGDTPSRRSLDPGVTPPEEGEGGHAARDGSRGSPTSDGIRAQYCR